MGPSDQSTVEARFTVRHIGGIRQAEIDEHTATLLGRLGYDNVDRIWIERVRDTGLGTADRTAFELHIVRTTDNGVAYEDTIDRLSESEREVTGLVFALAGHLFHETVPFTLLDSLEAIDPDRIATLIWSLSDYATHLVVALLPEDAQALDGVDARITAI